MDRISGNNSTTGAGFRRLNSPARQKTSIMQSPVDTKLYNEREIKNFQRSNSRMRGATVVSTLKELVIENQSEYDKFFKITVIGPQNAGKTALVRQYYSQEFTDEYHPTFGMQNRIKRVVFADLVVHLSIWDTPSDDRFVSQISFNLSSSDAILLVYDGTDPASLAQLNKLLEEVSDSINTSDCVLYLISTKKDQRKRGGSQYLIPKAMITKYNLRYLSISSRSGRMVEELFEQLIETLLNKESMIEKDAARMADIHDLVHSEVAESIRLDTVKSEDGVVVGEDGVVVGKDPDASKNQGIDRTEEQQLGGAKSMLKNNKHKTLQSSAFSPMNSLYNQKPSFEPESYKNVTTVTDPGNYDAGKNKNRKYAALGNRE